VGRQVEGMFRGLFMNHAYNKNSCRKAVLASTGGRIGNIRGGLPFKLGHRMMNPKFMGHTGINPAVKVRAVSVWIGRRGFIRTRAHRTERLPQTLVP
jgi:hypothetical protein